jgi:hypothetical protein
LPRDEGHRQCIPAENRPLAKEQSQEFSPAISTTRAGDAPLMENAKFEEIRRPSRLNPEPLQHGAPSPEPLKFQA